MVVVVDNIEGCTFLDVDIGMYEINLWADIAVLTYAHNAALEQESSLLGLL